MLSWYYKNHDKVIIITLITGRFWNLSEDCAQAIENSLREVRRSVKVLAG